MDQCVTVERELEKVLHKFSGYGQLCERGLEELIDYTGGLKHEILQSHGQDAELSGTLSLVLTQCCKRIKDTVQKLASDHKDIHSSVSRVGKAIDKESGLSVDPSQKEPFVELNRILEALKVRVLRPALEWAVSNREMLIAQNSSLEFKLHRLYFISLLMGGTTNQREALQYAKNFQPFALNHQKDIQVLMGSLVYLRQGIENSPYVHLLDANQWADICDIFTRDACALLGLSVESPLSVSFSAGCVALPALINIKAVIEQRQCTGVWNQKDELPIEVDLGKKCWYHSIFACPILRQQTTDNNPPMKLVCGHIISRDALNKMFNGSKLKCPYCPMEQSPGDAKQIFF
ncbi:protein RMD5 homolog A isoform X2 [Neophocaena asiaeorientalis asiaeorientalis]|uniref:Protein RMD5 homolog A isoform X2 n=1 Tax=Neophocaena asiaeorientalis asiaeorientalis TaxID=1706337 RepID=A0A341BBK1_NEOAA|nr:protein RMD5 homolog A isoform X2 [Neophocaena asiaeorientalis asiaeorientalis]XP_032508042.1 E3 ubiquitin-protein transferase RMND5A isoform X2 [Phocoena sinus]